MKKRISAFNLLLAILIAVVSVKGQTVNPIIYADVPDMSMIRVGDTYYMSSTTMHMSPGVPIMKSKDLVNWKLVSYAYDSLDSLDALDLSNGKSAYGAGSWASSIRYHNGTYYVSTFAQTTNKTYIYSTKNIEKGPWKKISFEPSLHDHSLFFDDDGKVYLINGGGKIFLRELQNDLSGIKPGTKEQVIIQNASLPASAESGGLPAEGSQLFKVNGKYYLFNISWPKGGMRTVIIHRSDKIGGPYEGRIALQDKGVAQGGLISTPKGEWFAYLFRDFGAVGRIPYLVPVKWEDGWPVLGENGKVPESLNLPPSKGINPGIVASDEFSRKKGEPNLPLAWQWNHNPDNRLWSLKQRPGYLRLKTGRVDTSILSARNTLTQRTFGPQSSAKTCLDLKNMKDGDHAGLMVLQKKYGWIGIKVEDGRKFLVMQEGNRQIEQIPLKQNKIYLKVGCDFVEKADKAYFSYSLDGLTWRSMGSVLQMSYTLPHFMGYRFGLFNYATKIPEGSVDFDFFRIDYKL
jgi:beta-xylosidase